jgi:predicted DNA-binding transcriptional regulator AlpA
MSQIPETGFLRLPQIIGDSKRGIPPLIPICKTSWWEGIRKGRFPKGIKLSYGVTVWRAEDIRKLIARAGKKEGAAA